MTLCEIIRVIQAPIFFFSLQNSQPAERVYLAALAALYLTLVSDSLTESVGATLEF